MTLEQAREKAGKIWTGASSEILWRAFERGERGFAEAD